ncbi:hypothetical protein GSI_09967 [Ganoderma sinense ZZ0214-1]|uniref:Uncharacterized protein n=1 Tax=Ganoderma sinense ZZ0214-1 TaxID=1077348 RepID=A0A2G8S2E8_9APHY|nr:hypothetical protein GSI_09967 [Ganoderma sinense ZZ0214-1]
MLALRCPVRRLTINTLNLEAIGAVQPRHLVLAPLQLPFYIAPPRPSQAHATAHPYLTHLVVISSFHSDDYFGGKISTVFRRSSALRADIAFERLVQTISLFTNVTCVRLVFYCYKDGPCENELGSFMRDIRAHAAESAGTQFAPPPHLLAACSQLRYFFVTAVGRDHSTPSAIPSQPRWNHARAWQVVDVEPGEGAQLLSGGSSDASATPIVEELCDRSARRVIEAEDLGLPEEWERQRGSLETTFAFYGKKCEASLGR